MLISEKIDLKKYLLLSLALLFTSLPLAKSWDEVWVMLSIFLAACLNQWMLVRGVLKLTSEVLGTEKVGRAEMIILFLGKFIVLVVALTFGVQIMQKRIIIPVLIYVLQIVVLYLSFKKQVREKE